MNIILRSLMGTPQRAEVVNNPGCLSIENFNFNIAVCGYHGNFIVSVHICNSCIAENGAQTKQFDEVEVSNAISRIIQYICSSDNFARLRKRNVERTNRNTTESYVLVSSIRYRTSK